jgi:hypothetical protein
MATIAEIHTSAFNVFQSLIPKVATITFPSTTVSILSNKKFKIVELSSSSLNFDRTKVNETTYSNEAVSITLLNSVLLATKDTTNTVSIPLYGFKDNNAKIFYKNKNYIVKDEILNPFDSSITLLCDTKV